MDWGPDDPQERNLAGKSRGWPPAKPLAWAGAGPRGNDQVAGASAAISGKVMASLRKTFTLAEFAEVLDQPGRKLP